MLTNFTKSAPLGATRRLFPTIVIIWKEMEEGTLIMQLSIIDALSVMAQASSINSADVTKLTALLQNSQTLEDVDDVIAAGAPAATVHRIHGWPIAETLEGPVEVCRSPPDREGEGLDLREDNSSESFGLDQTFVMQLSRSVCLAQCFARVGAVGILCCCSVHGDDPISDNIILTVGAKTIPLRGSVVPAKVQ